MPGIAKTANLSHPETFADPDAALTQTIGDRLTGKDTAGFNEVFLRPGIILTLSVGDDIDAVFKPFGCGSFATTTVKTSTAVSCIPIDMFVT
jgi:BRCT domain type II-containing protein